jgi:hypothetical protein
MPQGSLTGTQIATKNYLVFNEFDTMDTQASRLGIVPPRLAWCENLQISNRNELAVVPAPAAAPFASPGGTAVKMWYGFVAGVDAIVIFRADGSMVAVTSAAAVVPVVPAATFSNPDVVIWQANVILVADPTAGYCAITFYPSAPGTPVLSKAGGLSPSITIVNGGSGYSSTPSVSIVGGSGSGAVITAASGVVAGVVTGLFLTAAGTGYQASDILSGNINAAASFTNATPTITMAIANPGWVVPGMAVYDNSTGFVIGTVLTYVGTTLTLNANAAHASAGTNDSLTFSALSITGGGGSNAFATAKQWPILQNFAPTTLAIFAGRVWIAAGRVLSWTGTGGYDDVSSAGAAGTTTINDYDLVHTITALRSLNNFLWIFGDESIKQIGSISVSGAITNFSIVTLSSDTGTTFPQSIASYNRLVLFANNVGIFAVLGSSVQKISNEMDGIFKAIDFSQQLSAALSDISSQRVYCLLVRYIDPVQSRTRSLLLTFQNRQWFVCSQGDNLKCITTAFVNNTVGSVETWGSSGPDLTWLLSTPTLPVSIILQTAATHHGKPMMGKKILRAAVSQLLGSSTGNMNLTIDTENETDAETYALAVSGTPTFQWQRTKGNGTGIYLGMTLKASGLINYRFSAGMIEYQDTTALASKVSA